jgi:hypothetical protein
VFVLGAPRRAWADGREARRLARRYGEAPAPVQPAVPAAAPVATER